jgi:hypothetical protein
LEFENIKTYKMKKKYAFFVLVGILFFSAIYFLAPHYTLAGAIEDGLGSIKDSFSTTGNGIAGATSVNDLAKKIINVALSITTGIAVVFLIIGGFWYITSAGNEEQAEKGRKTVVNSIIGIIIIVLSYVIAQVVINLVAYNRV